MTDNIKQLQEEVNTILKEGKLSGSTDVEVSRDEKVIINLYWGDWKHDHGYLKHLMAQHGFIHVFQEVTEEDGSDCYSAEHTFIKAS